MSSATVLIILFICSSAMGDECSSFEFEKKLLEMLVRLEFEINQTNQKLTQMETKFSGEIEEMKKDKIPNLEVFETCDDNATNVSKEIDEKLAKGIEDGLESVTFTLMHLISKKSAPSVYFFCKRPRRTLTDERPIFKDELHNEGDSYNETVGLFTCRVPGLYHFSFSFTSKKEVYTFCSLYKNGSPVVRAFAKGYYNTGSIAVYLYLDAWNTVEIRCYNWGTISYDDSMVFSGTLIVA